LHSETNLLPLIETSHITSELVSVVVPAFNVGPYILRCINSILTQTHRAVELIVVDDCSSDDTAAILDRKAGEDGRLRVIHLSENGGVHAARAAGVRMASGAYLGFVDADDWAAPGMYGAMLREARDHDADIVICGAIATADVNQPGRPKARFRRHRVLENDLLRRFCHLEFGSGVLWNKLYRASVIRPFAVVPLEREVDAAEDYIVNVGCFAVAARVVTLPESYYYYYKRPESASRTGTEAAKFCRVVRAYTACLEVYAASLPHSLAQIDWLYARQLRHDCYRVPHFGDLEPFRQEMRESMRRLAAVRPESIYPLIHAFDRENAEEVLGVRAAVRGLRASGQALIRAVCGKSARVFRAARESAEK